MDSQKNLVLAVALSIIVFVGFNYFYISHKQPQQEIIYEKQTPKVIEKDMRKAERAVVEIEEALSLEKRVTFETDLVKGSINLKNGGLDDFVLKKYQVTVEENSPLVRFLNPYETQNAYYIEFDYKNQSNSEVFQWNNVVSPTRDQVILEGDSPTFAIRRLFKFKDDYIVMIEDEITNKKENPVQLQCVGSINRLGNPEVNNMMILHEGAVGVLKNKLKEVTYSKFAREQIETKGGWLGITDKYWMSAFLVPDNAQATGSINKIEDGYQVAMIYPSNVLKGGQSVTQKYCLFIGAKELNKLELIEKNLNVKNLDLAVDFGWFYFITKPLFKILGFFKMLLGNFGLSILTVTFLSKIILFPLTLKSQRSMMDMKRVQPKIEQIKKKYENDKIKQHQELMALYKRENVRPMAGCLPLLVQVPIFFCLYKVLYVTIEMRHAPFYGWIHDLSAPDPTSFFNMFGLFSWDIPGVFMIGAWPLLMGITMWLQQRLTPQVATDTTQEKMMLIMPVLFTYLFASFPAGLVIYWTWSNVLSIVQQLYINYKFH